MGQINLYDKFFHSPNWDDNRRDCSLEKLRDIFKSGYILSSQKLGIRSPYPYPYKPDRVYFAVHPDGEFASLYRGIDYYTDCNTAYEMTLKGQYFILNSQLKEDYQLESGIFDCECTALDQVELDKYLVGIGNAGFSIDDDLVICFNLVRYFNGEITEAELTNIIRARVFIVTGNIDRFLDYSYNYLTSYNHFANVVTRDVNTFIDVGNYHEVVRILEEENRNITLYDKFGVPINREDNIMEIKRMLEYIRSKLELLKQDDYAYTMRNLKERLRENIKKH